MDTGAFKRGRGGLVYVAGQFHWIDAIAMDSTGKHRRGGHGETYQKFVLTNGDRVKRPRPHE